MGGGRSDAETIAVLSSDKSKWIVLTGVCLAPGLASGGIVCLNNAIYTFGDDSKFETYQKLHTDGKRALFPLTVGRSGIKNSCLAFIGFIWVFGGASDENEYEILKSVERYDPKARKWTNMP